MSEKKQLNQDFGPKKYDIGSTTADENEKSSLIQDKKELQNEIQDEMQNVLANAYDKRGLGFFHWMQLTINGFRAMSFLTIVTAISFVEVILAREWFLSASQAAWVVFVAYIGYGIGVFFAGPVSDKYGRKWPNFYSTALLTIFGALSAFTTGYWSFLGCYFFCAIGCGMTNVITIITNSEFSVSKHRGWMLASIECITVIGYVLSCILALYLIPTVQNARWRLFLFISWFAYLIPLICGAYFIPDTHFYLYEQGRIQECNETCDYIFKMNGHQALTDEEKKQIKKSLAQKQKVEFDWKEVFSKEYITGTLISSLIWYDISSVQLGVTFVLPTILDNYKTFFMRDMIKDAIFANFFQIVAFCYTLLVISQSRLWGLRIHLIAFTFFTYGTLVCPIDSSLFLWSVGGINFAGYVIIVFLGNYQNEFYPTRIRGSGNSFSQIWIAVGSIIGPFIGISLSKTNISLFWSINFLVSLVTTIVSFGLTIETKDRKLDFE